DTVDRDAVTGLLEGESFGEAGNARLGCAIVGLAELTPMSVDGRDVDDAAEAIAPHVVYDIAAHVEDGTKVGVDHPPPRVRRHVLEGCVGGGASIVDEHADRAQLADDLYRPSATRLEVGHIPLEDRYARFDLK